MKIPKILEKKLKNTVDEIISKAKEQEPLYSGFPLEKYMAEALDRMSIKKLEQLRFIINKKIRLKRRWEKTLEKL